MNDKWVNRITFWLLAVVPFAGLFLLLSLYGAFWFSAFLLIYILLYRPILHIFRLLTLKKIDEKDAWKLFLPFYHTRYWKNIWFG
jgi:hypothetical protein